MSGTVGKAKVQKTYRLSRDLVEQLEARATKKRTMTHIVEEALRAYFQPAAEEGPEADGLDARASAHGSVQAPPESPERADPAWLSQQTGQPELVDLAAWLSQRTDNPRSLCRKFIADGRVSIAGAPTDELDVHPGRLDEVALDGARVPE